MSFYLNSLLLSSSALSLWFAFSSSAAFYPSSWESLSISLFANASWLSKSIFSS